MPFIFKSKGEITSSEYAQKYKVTDRTTRTDLNELVEKELITKKGETKSSIYFLFHKEALPLP
ncbi:MAG: DeoR family transcriptional regulator [Bacteroidales bacterium]|jgi:Fic family protein|nr:DeoR family transcriptional regulator [Bacteroidales bacterium]